MDLRSLWRRFGGSAAAGSGPGPDAADSVDASGEGPAGSAGAARHVAVERPGRPAWRDLPPISRAVAAHPLVAPTVSFSHELSGHQPAPLALEVLGHDRPADAPAGVVTGLFVGHSPHTPVQDEGGGTAQASVRGHAPRPGDTADARIESTPPRLAGSAPAAPVGPTSRQRAGSTAASPAIAPAHRPVVARSVAGSSAPAAMTSAPPTAHAAPAGSIGRPAVAGSSPAAPGPVPADTGAPVDGSVTPTMSFTATPVEAGPSVPGAVARRNLGQTRRLRIGPAIGSGALETGDAGSSEGHRPDRSQASGRAAADHGPMRDLSLAGGPPGQAVGLPAREGESDPAAAPSIARPVAGPDAPHASDVAPASAIDVLPYAAAPGALPRAVPARPVGPPRIVERAPLVGRLEVGRGSRPATGSVGVGPRPGIGPQHADAAPPRSTVQEALAALSGAATNVSATGFGGGGGVTPADWPGAAIQRSAADASWTGSSPTSMEAGDGGATSSRAGAATRAALAFDARSAGASSGLATVAHDAPRGSWSGPIRQLGATSAAHPERGRTSGGPGIVGTVASRAISAPAARAVVSQPATGTIWRSADAGHDDDDPGPDAGDRAGPSDALQRLAAGAIAGAASPVATVAAPTVLRAADGGDGGSAGAAGAGGSEKELDELARKLFPRLQLRLRSELLIDRERIGALVDLGR